MKIPKSEAVLLPNKTYPIKDEPGYYIAELDVFHQLHCLVSPSRILYLHLNSEKNTVECCQACSSPRILQPRHWSGWRSRIPLRWYNTPILDVSPNSEPSYQMFGTLLFIRCSADISVNVWQWSIKYSGVVGYSTQAHSCRNFNKLRDWARERRIHKWIDTEFFIEDGLPTPPVIS